MGLGFETSLALVVDPSNKSLNRDRALVAVSVLPHSHFAGLLLAVADHEHVRDLAQLGVTNLARHRLTPVVELGPHACGSQLLEHGGPIVDVTVGDRQGDRWW